MNEDLEVCLWVGRAEDGGGAILQMLENGFARATIIFETSDEARNVGTALVKVADEMDARLEAEITAVTRD